MSRPRPESLIPPASDEPQPTGESAAAKPQRSFLSEFPVLILIAFVLALLLKTFLVQAFYIPSRSMEPTLLVGDRVLVNKVVFHLRDPRRGEIVVFTHPDHADIGAAIGVNPFTRVVRALASGFGLSKPGEKDFIKRVIGLPGDTIEVRHGVVYVNGRQLPEASAVEGGYLSMRDDSDYGPVTVRSDHYFLMGDNRPNSDDSRGSLGQISRDELVGRAFVIIWPFPNLGLLPVAEYRTPLGSDSEVSALASGRGQRSVAVAFGGWGS